MVPHLKICAYKGTQLIFFEILSCTNMHGDFNHKNEAGKKNRYATTKILAIFTKLSGYFLISSESLLCYRYIYRHRNYL